MQEGGLRTQDVLATTGVHIGGTDFDRLLNLAYVDSIDSSGIGELVSAFTSTKKANGQLKLFNLSRKLRGLLLATMLFAADMNSVAARVRFHASTAPESASRLQPPNDNTASTTRVRRRT